MLINYLENKPIPPPTSSSSSSSSLLTEQIRDQDIIIQNLYQKIHHLRNQVEVERQKYDYEHAEHLRLEEDLFDQIYVLESYIHKIEPDYFFCQEWVLELQGQLESNQSRLHRLENL